MALLASHGDRQARLARNCRHDAQRHAEPLQHRPLLDVHLHVRATAAARRGGALHGAVQFISVERSGAGPQRLRRGVRSGALRMLVPLRATCLCQRHARSVRGVEGGERQRSRNSLAAQEGALKAYAFLVAERYDLHLGAANDPVSRPRGGAAGSDEERTEHRGAAPGASSRSTAFSAEMATTTPSAPS